MAEGGKTGNNFCQVFLFFFPHLPFFIVPTTVPTCILYYCPTYFRNGMSQPCESLSNTRNEVRAEQKELAGSHALWY